MTDALDLNLFDLPVEIWPDYERTIVFYFGDADAPEDPWVLRVQHAFGGTPYETTGVEGTADADEVEPYPGLQPGPKITFTIDAEDVWNLRRQVYIIEEDDRPVGGGVFVEAKRQHTPGPTVAQVYVGYPTPAQVTAVIVEGSGGGGGGVTAHGDLTGRSSADQHPQSAITGLVEALLPRTGFVLGQLGQSQAAGAWLTPAPMAFTLGFWASTTVTIVEPGPPGSFFELLSQPMDDGVGTIDAFEWAITLEVDGDELLLIPYFEATRVGGTAESIQFLADPRYYAFLGPWPDDGWRMKLGIPTPLACSLEFDVGGTWRGRHWRGVDDPDDAEYTDPDGGMWRRIVEFVPGAGSIPPQGPGSIIVGDEPIEIGRDLGIGIVDQVTVRNGVDGTLLARPKAADAVGRTEFDDDTGRTWTAGPDTWAGNIEDIALSFPLATSAGGVDPDDLAAVATSGDYDDLTNKPTIPSTSGLVPETRTLAGLDLTTDRSASALLAALASGTPSGSNYLRGDGTWSAPAAAVERPELYRTSIYHPLMGQNAARQGPSVTTTTANEGLWQFILPLEDIGVTGAAWYCGTGQTGALARLWLYRVTAGLPAGAPLIDSGTITAATSAAYLNPTWTRVNLVGGRLYAVRIGCDTANVTWRQWFGDAGETPLTIALGSTALNGRILSFADSTGIGAAPGAPPTLGTSGKYPPCIMWQMAR